MSNVGQITIKWLNLGCEIEIELAISIKKDPLPLFNNKKNGYFLDNSSTLFQKVPLVKVTVFFF